MHRDRNKRQNVGRPSTYSVGTELIHLSHSSMHPPCVRVSLCSAELTAASCMLSGQCNVCSVRSVMQCKGHYPGNHNQTILHCTVHTAESIQNCNYMAQNWMAAAARKPVSGWLCVRARPCACLSADVAPHAQLALRVRACACRGRLVFVYVRAQSAHA